MMSSNWPILKSFPSSRPLPMQGPPNSEAVRVFQLVEGQRDDACDWLGPEVGGTERNCMVKRKVNQAPSPAF